MSGLDLKALEDGLRNWIQSKVPEDWVVTWSDQNAPKPIKQIVLKRGDIAKIGRDVSGSVNSSTGARPVLGTREIMIDARAFSIGATQVLSDVITLMDDETTDDAFIAFGFTTVESSKIRDLTTLYSPQFKEAAQVDIRLRAHSLRESADAEQGVGYIHEVDLEVTTKDPAGTATVENLHVTGP